MIKEFILPDIGEGVVECELVEWLVQEGDVVVEDQPIADVMTDKALVQIPAPYAGTIAQLHYAKGEIAKVHQPLYSVEVAHLPAAQPLAPSASKGDKGSQPRQIEEFLLPDIGEGIVECELVEWLVNEGDNVIEDQPIADVMTDKALVQIPAIKQGKITKLYYQKGQLAKVHAPLFAIEVADDNHSEAAASELPMAEVEAQHAPIHSAPISQSKALASPAVRRLARSLTLDLASVKGSGKQGRVLKEDIERHQAAALNSQSVITTQEQPTSLAHRVEPIKGIRAVMAKMMTESVSTIPHFTYCEEFDLTELVALRDTMKKQYSTDELKLTMMPFFMKSMSLALTQFPDLNSQVNDDCTEQTFFSSHNIGMAVDAKVGLLVPNVKDVQDKSILAIAAEITRLTAAARSGRVSPADLKGGTISISNIGALGGTVATPIINKPEVAIVALGRLQVLPRFNQAGEVEARKIMQVSWSGDHRVIDGGTIARFCNLWKRYLEQPQEMLLVMQ